MRVAGLWRLRKPLYSPSKEQVLQAKGLPDAELAQQDLRYFALPAGHSTKRRQQPGSLQQDPCRFLSHMVKIFYLPYLYSYTFLIQIRLKGGDKNNFEEQLEKLFRIVGGEAQPMPSIKNHYLKTSLLELITQKPGMLNLENFYKVLLQ